MVLKDFPADTSESLASDAQHAQRQELKGSLWAFMFKGRKISIHLQKIDLRMLEFLNTPSHSKAKLS
jgi:hypothetical protein